jgi:hypothetical protein
MMGDAFVHVYGEVFHPDCAFVRSYRPQSGDAVARPF